MGLNAFRGNSCNLNFPYLVFKPHVYIISFYSNYSLNLFCLFIEMCPFAVLNTSSVWMRWYIKIELTCPSQCKNHLRFCLYFGISDVFYKVNLSESSFQTSRVSSFSFPPWGFWCGKADGDTEFSSAFFLSDLSWCAETIFPANQELDSNFPEAWTRNCHASALPCHCSEPGKNTHRGTDTQ